MARIVTKPFVLQYPDQKKKAFGVGDVVEGDDAEHWYVQAHSDVIPAADPAPADESEKPKRRKAKEEETADPAPADEAKD